jgi:hypothetical protein
MIAYEPSVPTAPEAILPAGPVAGPFSKNSLLAPRADFLSRSEKTTFSPSASRIAGHFSPFAFRLGISFNHSIAPAGRRPAAPYRRQRAAAHSHPMRGAPTTMCIRFAATIALLLLASFPATGEELNKPPQDFTAIFNGEDLKGWKGGTTHDPATITPEEQAKWDADVPRHWRVEKGELVNDGHEPHLVTDRDYGDFEMWVDWKLAPNGDSGIYLRGCPQVQLWDPTNEAAHQHGSDKGSGGLWNNQTHERFPPVVADKPIGQWNRMYVRMVGEHVKVVLNDETVVDDVVLENYFDRNKPVPRTGAIHLQTHGSETRFRNLFVREIPPEEADDIIQEIEGGDEGFSSLFNGRDLTGWIGAADDYEIVDGAIQCKPGRGGTLLTDKEYDNFIVRMKFRLPPGGNNGLAVRVPADGKLPSQNGMEIQVLDDSPEHYPDLHDYQAHGSVYGLAAAACGYLRPTGQWNYQQTLVDGDHLVVRLNGFKITDVDLAQARKNPLDGQPHPGAARTSGHFGFCGHHDPVAFRDVEIKPLP